MKCNNCGAENNDNAKFCQECGAKLESFNPEDNKKKCRICGALNDSDATFCILCGSQLRQETKQEDKVYDANPYGQSNNQYDRSIYSNTDPNAKLATISMILGIAAVACCLTCCLFIIGFICGVIATVLAIIYLVKSSNSNYPKGRAIAGLVCGVIGIIVGLYMTVSIVYCLTDPEMQAYIQQKMDEIYGTSTGEGDATGEGFKIIINSLFK